MAVRVGDKVFSPVTNFGRRSAGGPRGAVEGGGGAGLGSCVTICRDFRRLPALCLQPVPVPAPLVRDRPCTSGWSPLLWGCHGADAVPHLSLAFFLPHFLLREGAACSVDFVESQRGRRVHLLHPRRLSWRGFVRVAESKPVFLLD